MAQCIEGTAAMASTLQTTAIDTAVLDTVSTNVFWWDATVSLANVGEKSVGQDRWKMIEFERKNGRTGSVE